MSQDYDYDLNVSPLQLREWKRAKHRAKNVSLILYVNKQMRSVINFIYSHNKFNCWRLLSVMPQSSICCIIEINARSTLPTASITGHSNELPTNYEAIETCEHEAGPILTKHTTKLIRCTISKGRQDRTQLNKLNYAFDFYKTAHAMLMAFSSRFEAVLVHL